MYKARVRLHVPVVCGTLNLPLTSSPQVLIKSFKTRYKKRVAQIGYDVGSNFNIHILGVLRRFHR